MYCQYKSDKRNFVNSYGYDSIDPVTVTAVGAGLAKGIGSLFGGQQKATDNRARVESLRNQLKQLGVADPTLRMGQSIIPARFAKRPSDVGRPYGQVSGYGRTGLIRDLETLVMEAQGIQVQPERPFTPTTIGAQGGATAGLGLPPVMLPEFTVTGERIPARTTAGINLGGGTLTTILVIGLVAVLAFMFFKK